MDNQTLNSMIKIIDDRSKKTLAEAKYTKRMMGKIVDVTNIDYPLVQLAGYTGASPYTASQDVQNNFPCYNTLGLNLAINDWVYILCDGTDLNTAIIIGKKYEPDVVNETWVFVLTNGTSIEKKIKVCK